MFRSEAGGLNAPGVCKIRAKGKPIRIPFAWTRVGKPGPCSLQGENIALRPAAPQPPGGGPIRQSLGSDLAHGGPPPGDSAAARPGGIRPADPAPCGEPPGKRAAEPRPAPPPRGGRRGEPACPPNAPRPPGGDGGRLANGAEAVARLEQARYDAVVLDCEMPVLDGFELARRIRSGLIAGTDRKLPIIALTAHTGRAERERCLGVGMNQCLAKPAEAEAIEAALAQCGLAPRRARGPAPAAVPAGPEARSAAPGLAVLDEAQFEIMRSSPGPAEAEPPGRLYSPFLPGRAGADRLPQGAGPPAPGRGARARRAHGRRFFGHDGGAGAAARRSGLGAGASQGDWDKIPDHLAAIDRAWIQLREVLAAKGFPSP